VIWPSTRWVLIRLGLFALLVIGIVAWKLRDGLVDRARHVFERDVAELFDRHTERERAIDARELAPRPTPKEALEKVKALRDEGRAR
jgi:hypothetical protein